MLKQIRLTEKEMIHVVARTTMFSIKNSVKNRISSNQSKVSQNKLEKIKPKILIVRDNWDFIITCFTSRY